MNELTLVMGAVGMIAVTLVVVVVMYVLDYWGDK